MIENNVCAIVVTFHPDADVLENLSKLREQVQWLVVVDNGSSQQSITLLHAASSQLGFELIENHENLGIAAALNAGVHWAESSGCKWVILFDQDSAVTEGFMEAMLRAYELNPLRERLAIVAPRYVDKRSGAAISQGATENGELESAMTSGSLMLTTLFREQGYFLEELFIDAVDYEYSLRLRGRGYLIEECKDAVLLHSPGNPTVIRFCGMRLFQTANYSPLRRYYQDRNRIWVVRRYWKKFPVFCLRLFKYSLHEQIKTLIGEDEKMGKCSSAMAGVVDGLRGRMGKTDRF
jgi:rhamnosyltransferase